MGCAVLATGFAAVGVPEAELAEDRIVAVESAAPGAGIGVEGPEPPPGTAAEEAGAAELDSVAAELGAEAEGLAACDPSHGKAWFLHRR